MPNPFRKVVGAVARQTLIGLLAVAASVPLLFGLSHMLGLSRPPLGGVALLGGSVLAAFAGAGLLGALLGLGGGLSRRWLGPTAALLGLTYGIFLCSAVFPFYTDDLVDQMTERGSEIATEKVDAGHLDKVLDHPADIVDQVTEAGSKLLQEGAASLPALALLGWTVLGPALAAPLEARLARKKVST